jgi:hypothetical protein
MKQQSKCLIFRFALMSFLLFLTMLSLGVGNLAALLHPASQKPGVVTPPIAGPVKAHGPKTRKSDVTPARASGLDKSSLAKARNSSLVTTQVSALAMLPRVTARNRIVVPALASALAKFPGTTAPNPTFSTALASAPIVQTQDLVNYIKATDALIAPACSLSDLDGEIFGLVPDLARANPEWKPILGLQDDLPTILEGFVPFPPADLKPDDQPTSEVSEEDVPWNHSTHDFTFKVVPDAPYQHLLSSWARFQGTSFPINNPDDPTELAACQLAGGTLQGNTCIVIPADKCPKDNPDPLADTCHHTQMEVEWENASLMDENGEFQRIRGAVPEFVWPAAGDRVWVSGRWIFDCGHPGVPAGATKDFVQFSTEIHPPRVLATFRLNHPALDSFPVDRVSAPSFTGPQSNLPVTGLPAALPGSEPTRVAVTEADIYVTGNGGMANDQCMLLPTDQENDCKGHTPTVIPVNNQNYVFDVYPPGTDFKKENILPNGAFPVTPPVPDASLQWRIVNHFSELPTHTCGTDNNLSCVTVDPIICVIDANTPPPTQAETKCPAITGPPTRLRVILPFAGSAANFFAQSILLGWDDVPMPGVNKQVRTFKITLHKFTIGQNGESFLHSGDWRVFVNVGGQYRYMDPLFDRDADGNNKCGGESLTDNGDDDCFQFDQTPWIVSVQDDTPIHVAVGGWESDLVDGHYCKKFPPDSDCDPFGAGDVLSLAQNNDRIGPYEFDLLPENNYRWVSADGALLTRFATHETSDGERYIVEFVVEEIPADTPPPSSPIQIGTPHFGDFVSSATPIVLSSPSAATAGFQYRSYAVGGLLPVYPFSPPQPYPVHWTSADFAAGAQSVPVFITGNDGPNLLQYSARSVANLLEPRHRETLILDNTPPVISINQPTATQYTHADTLTIDYNVSDGAGSGVKSSTATIDGRTTLPSGRVIVNGMKIDLFSELSLGTHTFSVTATDNVDNSATKSITFSIIVTPDSLEQDVNILTAFGCIDNGGIAGSLISKIEATKSRIAAGDTHSAINTLGALLNQLFAQAGKHISTGCTDPNTQTQFNPAQLLITDVQALLANLKTAGVVNPIMGYVVTATDGVGGAVVSLLDANNVLVATANTDSTGFYFFAHTDALVTGASYTVRVSTIPKPNVTSVPVSQTFIWCAAQVSLDNFLLN